MRRHRFGKKLLALVTSLALLCSLLPFGAMAADESSGLADLKGKGYENAAKTLVELGVITGYGDGKFGGEKDVTRAEMAVIIMRALGISEGMPGGSPSGTFSDTRNHWAAPYIDYAKEKGLINGYSDGTFKPDSNVTYYEALAMIIKSLGYNDQSLQGAWPNKFVVKAQNLGISNGLVITGGNATRGDIAILLYQSLDQKVGTTDQSGTWKENTGKNTMFALLGATEVGPFTVVATEKDSIVSNKSAEAGKAVLRAYTWAAESKPGPTQEVKPLPYAETTMDTSIDMSPYFGHTVKLYTRNDKILAVKEVLSTSVTLKGGETLGDTLFPAAQAGDYVPVTFGSGWAKAPAYFLVNQNVAKPLDAAAFCKSGAGVVPYGYTLEIIGQKGEAGFTQFCALAYAPSLDRISSFNAESVTFVGAGQVARDKLTIPRDMAMAKDQYVLLTGHALAPAQSFTGKVTAVEGGKVFEILTTGAAESQKYQLSAGSVALETLKAPTAGIPLKTQHTFFLDGQGNLIACDYLGGGGTGGETGETGSPTSP